MRTPLILALVALLVSPAAGAGRQAGFARARELYLSAAYDDALAMLDGLQEKTSGSAGMDVAQYRAFCLLALQRTEEATKVIVGMLDADPSYRMSDPQASPRVAVFFQAVRRAVLPAIVRRAYTEARASLDHKDPRAAAQFDRVLALLSDPDMRDAADADFTSLVTGFRDLSRAIAPAPSPVSAASGPVVTAPPAPAPTTMAPPIATRPAPAITPPPVASTSTPAPPVASTASDEAAVAATLRAYERAYSERDVAAVIGVFPSVNATLLTQGFAQMKAQRIEILRPQLAVSGTTAIVTCQLRQRFEPRTGRSSDATIPAIFRLQRSGDVWVIVDRR